MLCRDHWRRNAISRTYALSISTRITPEQQLEPSGIRIFIRPVILVAHPDDEAACVTILQRAVEPLVFFCTDGAPEARFFWKLLFAPGICCNQAGRSK